jgi:hypothetical protein
VHTGGRAKAETRNGKYPASAFPVKFKFKVEAADFLINQVAIVNSIFFNASYTKKLSIKKTYQQT